MSQMIQIHVFDTNQKRSLRIRLETAVNFEHRRCLGKSAAVTAAVPVTGAAATSAATAPDCDTTVHHFKQK